MPGWFAGWPQKARITPRPPREQVGRPARRTGRGRVHALADPAAVVGLAALVAVVAGLGAGKILRVVDPLQDAVKGRGRAP